ncbi:hypothetical protein NRY68_15080 [Acidithiobacillus ferrooxidans]|jgi:hypothetical protein|uniref:hypothetical protein n=1 Tax=Acidithiobacillus ferrooxidans TaxID=920 RepID=UPI002149564B|nr:hypothetical protein [Acidithiobacillus ferrooxidans]MCR1347082.1 hypothetical protein [Acidithiobacillus ferrooxidans]MCR1355854.1 hypothetical protein [Acidithiobacillus ferrooxidans]MDA8376718.1 hypothetical protein [Planctomycetia bacterium]
MGLTIEHKARRDRARAWKAIQKSPKILREMLVSGFDSEGARTKKGILQVAAQLDKKKSWLGTSLLKNLVGRGYLRPEGAGYRITAKGLALRNQQGPVAGKPSP